MALPLKRQACNL